jgi:hypothetical protein
MDFGGLGKAAAASEPLAGSHQVLLASLINNHSLF